MTTTHRNFAHLGPGDVALLDALAAARGRDAARDFERLLEAQHRDATRFRARQVLADADLGISDAAYSHGAGGGVQVGRRAA